MAAVLRCSYLYRLTVKTLCLKLEQTYLIKMNNISNVKFGPLVSSNYLKPLRMTYTQDGKDKSWDIMTLHDCVTIIIYNSSRKKLIFVKQFRPGVYFSNIPCEIRNKPIDMEKYPAELGITMEFCAGIVDKQIPLEQIAQEEILEECGYDVPLEKLERLYSFNSNIGTSGNILTLYYCEVTDDMKVTEGGGVESEMIDVIEMSLDECKAFTGTSHILTPGSVLVGYYWFLANKNQNSCV